MATMLTAALALGLLAAGWSAGFFWAWSFTVMPGLAAAPPEAAAAAMRAVNADAAGPGFAFVLFSPAVFAALSAVLAFAAGAGGSGRARRRDPRRRCRQRGLRRQHPFERRGGRRVARAGSGGAAGLRRALDRPEQPSLHRRHARLFGTALAAAPWVRA